MPYGRYPSLLAYRRAMRRATTMGDAANEVARLQTEITHIEDGDREESYRGELAELRRQLRAANDALDAKGLARTTMAPRYQPGRFSNLETRGVLGGRYRGKGAASDATTLTHTYDEDANRTLCNKVDPDGLADSYAQDVDARPTCPACLAKDPRFK